MKRIALALVLCLFAVPAWAQPAPTILPGGCGTASFTNGVPYLTMDSTGHLCVGGGSGGAVPIAFPTAPTTVTAPSVPTPGTFVAVLAANTARKACTVTNIGTTQGYCNAILQASATTSNTMPVNANGGMFSCTSPGGGPPASNAISCTCASGTCSFVVNEQ